MTRSQAEILRQAIIDLGLGVVGSFNGAGIYNGSPWPVFATNEPDSPDNCLTVYDTTGMIDGRDMFGSIDEHYGFQLRVRSFGHSAGNAKINAIRNILSMLYQETVAIGTGRYFVHCVAKFGPVMYLGIEVPNSRRSLFTVNAVASIREL